MKRKTIDGGFSLVEMVVAMGILSIFLPFMISMMANATTASNVAMTSSQNSVSASSISKVLENDIKRSGTFRSYYNTTNGNVHTIRMARADGKCVAWKIDSGNAQRIETDATKLTSTWPNIDWNKSTIYSDKANTVGNEAVFTWVDGTTDQGKLQYKIQLGDKNAATIIEGIVEPEVISNGRGYCW